MTIALIAGTRPNFIKAAPLWKAMQQAAGIQASLIHTGQHQDAAMSTVFWEALGLPHPDFCIPGQGATVIQESARISLGLEPILKKLHPDWVVVIGDVTSTLAATVAAKQLGLRVAHVEAGLRSGDRNMPEELNRIAVDQLADLLFPSEEAGLANLKMEGIALERIHFTGNVLIDALQAILPKANKLTVNTILGKTAQEKPNRAYPTDYALCTFHRPSNVDTKKGLQKILELLETIGQHIPVIFPVHPRTRQNIQKFALAKPLLRSGTIWTTQPLGYAEIICLAQKANFIVTDSGGLQEESTWLGVPCLTFRRNTERPATVTYGTNTIISDLEIQTVVAQIEVLLAGNGKKGQIPPLWDGQAAVRIVDALGTTF
jgi:UDP-N-acetylglucosamine 2-epimerase (non-hydrolysing)